jgi:hypothetical protein
MKWLLFDFEQRDASVNAARIGHSDLLCFHRRRRWIGELEPNWEKGKPDFEPQHNNSLENNRLASLLISHL